MNQILHVVIVHVPNVGLLMTCPAPKTDEGSGWNQSVQSEEIAIETETTGQFTSPFFCCTESSQCQSGVRSFSGGSYG